VTLNMLGRAKKVRIDKEIVAADHQQVEGVQDRARPATPAEQRVEVGKTFLAWATASPSRTISPGSSRIAAAIALKSAVQWQQVRPGSSLASMWHANLVGTDVNQIGR
jgi:hypothetical protein